MTIRIAGIRGTKEFKLNLKKAANLSENVARRALTELTTSIIYSTPVNTGRLRGNWQTANTVTEGETGAHDLSGMSTASKAKSFLAKHDFSGSFAFFNNVPYALVIERGHSQQAPAGMVAVNVARFETMVKKAISREGDK